MKTKQLRCKDIAQHVCEHLDEGMHSPKCKEILKHLKSCPNCTAYLDSMKKTVRLYRTYPDPKLPARCRKQLFAVLKFKS
jgi:predicted anti-sigma-YlaC factor YlaD